MKNHKLGGIIALFITSIIWGGTFAIQSVGLNFLEPFAFNGLRALVAVIGLSILLLCIKLKNKQSKLFHNKKVLWLSMVCGIVLFAATSLQQVALGMTPVGKAGFIGGLYVILVPLIGIFFKQKTSLKVWLCVVLSLVGLYFLCFQGSFSIQLGDILLLISALGFAGQIMIIDYITKDINSILLSIIQFFTVFILSLIPMFFFEELTWKNTVSALPYLLFAGILSSGIAYTLQIVGQKYTPPAVASLILCLESVFAALAGFIFLNETLSLKEYIGCAIIFIAIILSQINFKKKDQTNNYQSKKEY